MNIRLVAMTAASERLRAPIFRKMLCKCCLIVTSARPSSALIAAMSGHEQRADNRRRDERQNDPANHKNEQAHERSHRQWPRSYAKTCAHAGAQRDSRAIRT